MEDTSLKVRLTKTVRDFDGSPFAKGSVLKTRIARDGVLEVVGAQHLPPRMGARADRRGAQAIC